MSAEPAQCAAAPYRWYVYAACTVLAVALNYAFGKDMAWDELSYHLYAGFSAVHDRFAQDYFPAGPQTYFNPYIYVPLYLLVSSDLSSLEISSVLAMVHSVMLWLTYELAVAVCPYDDKYRRLVFGLCRHHERRISAGRLAVARPRSSRAEHGAGRRCRPAVRHSYRVETDQRRSRNLGLRHSNNVAADSARAIPSGTCLRHFSGAWFSPHRRAMVLSSRAEVRQSRFSIDEPPIPLAGIYHRAAASSAFHSGLARRGSLAPVRHDRSRNDGARRNEGSGSAVCHPGGAGWRSALSLAVAASRGLLNPIGGRRRCGFGAYTYSDRLRARCGLSGSGNSRYFLPMSSVAAVVLVALIYKLFAMRPKVRNYVLAGILGVQGVQLWMGADYRWNEAPWDAQWINIGVPVKLRSEASLYLTIGAQTNSFLALYLAPGSGLINFSGLYTLGPDGANGARIESLVRRYAPNIRMLIRGARLYRNDERRLPNRVQIDDALRPFGLRVDDSDCATIAVHGLTPDLEFTIATSQPTVPQARDTTYLLSCHVVPDKSDYSAQLPARRDIDLVLDHLEDACPALFEPRRPRTEYIGDGGLRRYGDTDLTAWVSHGLVKFMQASLGGDAVFLGREIDWTKAPVPVQCGRRDGRYFAILPDSAQRPRAAGTLQ